MRFLLAGLVAVSAQRSAAPPTEVKASVDARLHLVAVCPEVSSDCGVPTGPTADPASLAPALDCMLKVDLSKIPQGPCYDAMKALLVNHLVPILDESVDQSPAPKIGARGPPMMPPFMSGRMPWAVPSGAPVPPFMMFRPMPPPMMGQPPAPQMPPRMPDHGNKGPRDHQPSNDWHHKDSDEKPWGHKSEDRTPPWDRKHHKDHDDKPYVPLPWHHDSKPTKSFDHSSPRPWDRLSVPMPPRPFDREDKHSRPPMPFDRDDMPPRPWDRKDMPPMPWDREPMPFDRDDMPPRPWDRKDKHSMPPMPFDRDDMPPRPWDRKDKHSRPPMPWDRDDRRPMPPMPFDRDDMPPRPWDREDKHSPFARKDKPSRPPMPWDRDEDKHAKSYKKSCDKKKEKSSKFSNSDDSDFPMKLPFFLMRQPFGASFRPQGPPPFPMWGPSSFGHIDDDSLPGFSFPMGHRFGGFPFGSGFQMNRPPMHGFQMDGPMRPPMFGPQMMRPPMFGPQLNGPVLGSQMSGPMDPGMYGDMNYASQMPMQQDQDASSPSLPVIAIVHAMMARAQAQPKVEIAGPIAP